ncbi:ShlB/FhaC/HecB family hemolysin secretion/activation protein [Methylobacterium sp. CB376]|uniref:ShlB/FhaC/HecB family hemolysin secretion/activation protein n=1 Tax=unclassified Methylobacterium TaxID=2615210 RepID=UPI000152D04B|nr:MULTISPECIES: ShlB/FhaC/HecB family hemolysin secretion/activation protein [Methylobacterium]WFT79261.1 ShlB/FhaC/HecB family hemolysin secretion/activation protein [Methylobacterium nodulans]
MMQDSTARGRAAVAGRAGPWPAMAIGALAAAAAGLVPARAQTASQITPPSFRPAPQARGAGLVIPEGAGPEAPPGAERVSVRLGAVAAEGTLPALEGATRALADRLAAGPVTLAQIFAAARDLEQAYAAEGYALVRVVLPAQALRDGGALRLVVIDGTLERIDTAALPPEIRDRVAALLAPLAGRRGLRLAEIERGLMLAGDTPGTVLRSTLAPGTAPGSSILVVEARYKPVTGMVGVDNTLSDALGRNPASLGLEMNSPTGHGEQLYLRAGGAAIPAGQASLFSPRPLNRSLAAGLILPLGGDGLTLNLEATDARTTAKPRPGNPAFTSDFSRYSARLRYPLIRARDLTLAAEASFDAQEERLTVIRPIEAPFSLDRLRVARASGDALWVLPTDGVLTARLTGSFGLDGLGARAAPLPGPGVVPLSRQGARPDFQKLEASLGLAQPLAEHLALDLRARAQTSFNQALPRAEQFGIASLSGLSSFDSGLFQGDEGYVLRGEVQFPFVASVPMPFRLPSLPAQLGTGFQEAESAAAGLVATPYGFGAFGLVRQQRPTSLERPMVRGASYGLGLRLAASPQASFTNLSASLEYGRSARSDRLPAEDRVTFSVTLQF